MPRLGTDAHSHPGDAGPPRSFSNAYSMPNRQLSLPSIVFLLMGAFILRNILFHDYRADEINLLKEGGITDEELEKYYVSKTPAEKRKEKLSQGADIERMKKDIEYLLQEVEILKGGKGDQKKKGSTGDGSEDAGGDSAEKE